MTARNTNAEFPHDLNGVTRVEIASWPEHFAVVVEDRSNKGILIEVDVASGEHWTYTHKDGGKTLQVRSNHGHYLRMERRMVVVVPPGKKNIVHFVRK